MVQERKISQRETLLSEIQNRVNDDFLINYILGQKRLYTIDSSRTGVDLVNDAGMDSPKRSKLPSNPSIIFKSSNIKSELDPFSRRKGNSGVESTNSGTSQNLTTKQEAEKLLQLDIDI